MQDTIKWKLRRVVPYNQYKITWSVPLNIGCIYNYDSNNMTTGGQGALKSNILQGTNFADNNFVFTTAEYNFTPTEPIETFKVFENEGDECDVVNDKGYIVAKLRYEVSLNHERYTKMFSLFVDKYGIGMFIYCSNDCQFLISPAWSEYNTFDEIWEAYKTEWVNKGNLYNSNNQERVLFRPYITAINSDQINVASGLTYSDYIYNSNIFAYGPKSGNTHNVFAHMTMPNLYNPWCWHILLFGTPYITPLKLKTSNDEDFELAIPASNEIAYGNPNDLKYIFCYDYQPGTDISYYVDLMNDTLIFNNGTEITRTDYHYGSATQINFYKTIEKDSSTITYGYKPGAGFAGVGYNGDRTNFNYRKLYVASVKTNPSIIFEFYYDYYNRNGLNTATYLFANPLYSNTQINNKLDELQAKWVENPSSIDWTTMYMTDDVTGSAICMISGTKICISTYGNDDNNYLKNNYDFLSNVNLQYIEYLVINYSRSQESVADYTAFESQFNFTDSNSWRELLEFTKPPKPTPTWNWGWGRHDDEDSGGEGSWDDSSDDIKPIVSPTIDSGITTLSESSPLYITDSTGLKSLSSWLNTKPGWFDRQDRLSGVVSVQQISITEDLLNYITSFATSTSSVDATVGGEYVEYEGSRVKYKYLTKQLIPETPLTLATYDFKEYFGNFLDYAPYTTVKIYLPYCGLQDINVDDFMNGKLKLSVKLDVYTGDILYYISSVKNNNDSILYTFNGNCSTPVPLDAQAYNNVTNSRINFGISAVAMIGAAAAVATTPVGAGASILGGSALGASLSNFAKNSADALSAKPQIQHSGAVAGQIGNLNISYPYLIITRPIVSIPESFGRQYGYTCNKTSVLSNLEGYTKVSDVHLENIPATSDEIDEIYNLLKEGVII